MNLVLEGDLLLRDEIETMNIVGDGLVGSYNSCSLLQSTSETMVVEMALEPVVTMIPVSQITQVTDFHYLLTFCVTVFLHCLGYFSTNLLNFVDNATATDEKASVHILERGSDDCREF